MRTQVSLSTFGQVEVGGTFSQRVHHTDTTYRKVSVRRAQVVKNDGSLGTKVSIAPKDFVAIEVEIPEPKPTVFLPELSHDDVVTIEGEYGTYKFGTVAGYALKSRECPMQATIRCHEQGQKLAWLSKQATVISDPPVARDPVSTKLKYGDVVYLDGGIYRVEVLQHNHDHATLVRLANSLYHYQRELGVPVRLKKGE